jgi:hypothetical protein
MKEDIVLMLLQIQNQFKKGFSNQVSELKIDQNYQSYGNLKFLHYFT